MSAKWIWTKDYPESKSDYYAGFKRSFLYNGEGKVYLDVSSDSAFAAYINGKLAGFSRCADYPAHKRFDRFEISKYLNENNEIYIIVWYMGVNSQNYIKDIPGLWFEISSEKGRILESDENTLSRLEVNYKFGENKMITSQLGLSFHYDNTVTNNGEYLPSLEVVKPIPDKRDQKHLILTERANAQYKQCDGYLLIDLGRETAGYLDLDFVSPSDQELLIAFGEHIENGGKVSRCIGVRDFSVKFTAKKGENKWFCPLRRIGARYLEVYSSEPITPSYFGIYEVNYPVNEIKRKFENSLMQKIYDVSVRTLRLCMHEHYEDTPWREQGLYCMDSRNQMLFGYHAFGEYEYPRSNLLLMNEGMNEHGLLSICFPAGRVSPIPSFSLAYILELSEYVEYTGDREIIELTKKTIDTLVDTFTKQIGSNGLISTFPAPMWNFYEWSEGSDRANEICREVDSNYESSDSKQCDYDLILNAMYVYVLEKYDRISGRPLHDTESIKKAIRDNLFDSGRGVYKLSVGDGRVTQLGQAFAILAGLGDTTLLEKMLKCENMVPATLSMKAFVYDAAIKHGRENFVLDDIMRVYTAMLDAGATSFWETEKGWRDFDNAGSLCHGWSALPVYYYTKLCKHTVEK